MNTLARFVISVGAGLGAAVVVAVTVAVVDLYMTGHGYGSLTREVISWPPIGMHLSVGDLAMLMTASAIALLAWCLTGKRI